MDRGKAWGGGVPSPAHYEEWRSLRQRGAGRSPGRKWVLVHLELETTHLMDTNFVFFGNAKADPQQKANLCILALKSDVRWHQLVTYAHFTIQLNRLS